MDHIIPGPITIENVGHGALAKRFLPEGSVFTRSPLTQTFRNFTNMYRLEKDSDDEWQRLYEFAVNCF
jgi:hypothetical protein